jgi:hypothetical protein
MIRCEGYGQYIMHSIYFMYNNIIFFVLKLLIVRLLPSLVNYCTVLYVSM